MAPFSSNFSTILECPFADAHIRAVMPSCTRRRKENNRCTWLPHQITNCGSFVHVLTRHTVDLEIFVVKIFSWFAQTTKIKKHKYILQRIIIIVRIFLFAQFHNTGSYFAQDGLFNTRISLKLMPNVKQLFTQCPRNCLSLLPQYVPTALLGSLLHATSPPTAAWYPRTQHASCAYT